MINKKMKSFYIQTYIDKGQITGALIRPTLSKTKHKAKVIAKITKFNLKFLKIKRIREIIKIKINQLYLRIGRRFLERKLIKLQEILFKNLTLKLNPSLSRG